jgi:hypothetical protein
MKDHLIAQVTAEKSHLAIQHVLQLLIGMDMQLRRTAQKSERGNHAYKSETVVTMQMRYEHMAHLGETHPATTQLHLHTFATIDHKQFIPNLNNLGGRIMTKGGQCTATP